MNNSTMSCLSFIIHINLQFCKSILSSSLLFHNFTQTE
nr:MAG TPA: hypothetical protein [Caudoviricetes sp.]DAW65804.1 MAG TPA: hypothetical protein [Bacteriophage sp.]